MFKNKYTRETKLFLLVNLLITIILILYLNRSKKYNIVSPSDIRYIPMLYTDSAGGSGHFFVDVMIFNKSDKPKHVDVQLLSWDNFKITDNEFVIPQQTLFNYKNKGYIEIPPKSCIEFFVSTCHNTSYFSDNTIYKLENIKILSKPEFFKYEDNLIIRVDEFESTNN